MSAITGIYYLDGRPVERADVERQVHKAAPWEADRTGVWCDTVIGMGHRMLFDTPESMSDCLPLVQGREYVLTADARIDNRDELISAFSLNDRPASEVTDSELILRAYEKWGDRCPERLIGDFAFALWDARRRRLLCARDPMGVKPFFYHHSSKAFVFGSSIQAILEVPSVPQRLNELRVAYHVIHMFEDQTITFYEDVLRLPGGQCLAVDANGCRTWTYWNLDATRELSPRSDEEYAEGLREVFSEAVRCRLRSVHPVGSMLSGGLDSSSIVCVAQDHLKQSGDQTLHTFSAIFPSISKVDSRIDERPFINAVVDRGGIEHHDVRADQVSPVLDIAWQGEEVLPALSIYMDWTIFAAARDAGVRVLMSGFDGDSTISYGYEYLEELARRGRWGKLLKEARALSTTMGVPVQRIIWRLGLRPLIPKPVMQTWRTLRGRSEPAWKAGPLINEPFARRINLADHVKNLSKNGDRRARTARQAHRQNFTSGLIRYCMEMLRTTADATSLDVRYPFFDRRLIEFSLAMPPEQKITGGVPRSVMRRAMKDVLPPEVQNRLQKGNLSSNFKVKLLEHEQDVIHDLLFNDSEKIEQYVDVAGLRDTYQRYVREPIRRENDAVNLFLAETLALWFRRTRLKV